jgi:hypothetical protein
MHEYVQICLLTCYLTTSLNAVTVIYLNSSPVQIPSYFALNLIQVVLCKRNLWPNYIDVLG